MRHARLTVAVLVAGLLAASGFSPAAAGSGAATGGGPSWSWGHNEHGQLGDGTPAGRPTPMKVALLSDAVSVSAGLDHSLALRPDGTVWSWGRNDFGQLGDGSRVDRPLPIRVRGLTGITAVSAGDLFSLALRRDGTVWAWGEDYVGQLGDGGPVSQNVDAHSAVPVQVRGLSGVRHVVAGGFHALALRTDGTVWSWGSNVWGELGDGTRTSRSLARKVAGLGGVRVTAAGFSFSLAVRGDGSVVAWGRNTDGQAGQGTYHPRDYRPTPVRVPNLTGVTAVAAGNETAYALLGNGTVAAWGRNDVGQVGDGTAGNSRARPTQVRTYRGPLTGIVALGSGPSRLGLALRSDGIAVSWGWNNNGSMGLGSYSPEVVVYARPLANLTRVRALAAGGGHGLAVTRP